MFSKTLIITQLTFFSLFLYGQNEGDHDQNFPPSDDPIEVIVLKSNGTINVDGKLD
ncbi:MAG: hypothetical protein P8M34_11205 [Saprospiraceae bacterium]|nr:hypothetical protein [Saprospiraceae bacterium]